MTRQLDHDRRIALLASRKHGVTPRAALLELGISATMIDDRLRLRRLVPLFRGVYALGQAELRDEGWWLASVEAYGARAVLSHGSAAALWGTADAPLFPVHVSVGRRSGMRQRPRTVIHRRPDLPEDEVSVRREIRVTSVARTILDVSAGVRGRHLEQIVRRASRRRLFDRRELEAIVARHPRYPGAKALGGLLTALRGVGTDDFRSTMEVAFAQLCDDYGLPRPVVNGFVEGERVDFHWPGTTLVVEADGFEFHAMPTSFADDRRRDQKLTLAGYTVVRLTWRQITDDARATAGTVAALLKRCGSR